jgi:hypothetical protein
MPQPGACAVPRVHATRAHGPIAPYVYTQYLEALQLELERERARRSELDVLYAQDLQLHINARQAAEEEALRLGSARALAENQARDGLCRLQHLQGILASMQELARHSHRAILASLRMEGRITYCTSVSPLMQPTRVRFQWGACTSCPFAKFYRSSSLRNAE